jgi:hypothetical protein
MSGLQWFALSKNYGEYGNISKSYKFKRTPKLLNIGNADVRIAIENKILETTSDPNLIAYLDPNEQYSGGPYNKKYHELVKNTFGDEYDGTIIDEKQLKGNYKYSKEDMEGPTEIVIWKDFDNLLKEQSNESRKRITKRKRKYKNKRKKTKRNHISNVLTTIL